MDAERPREVVIAGHGPVGMVLALALEQAGVQPLLLADGGTPPDRPIALAHGSCLLLERLGIMQQLDGTPIRAVHVSQRGGFGRTLITAEDQAVPRLGEVVSYRQLLERLRAAVRAQVLDARLTGWRADAQGVSVHWTAQAPGSRSGSVPARLLVLADGSPPRNGSGSAGPRARTDEARRRIRGRDYAQTAVVAHIKCTRAHGGTAWERFTPEGPIALLPERDGLALVWTTAAEKARRLCDATDAEFLDCLQGDFGDHLGRFCAVGPRTSFPVSLVVAAGVPDEHVIAIGNAAQSLHPVAGQGLNLGLRDAWELAELVAATPSASLGNAEFVRRFVQGRTLDRRGGIGFTDSLVRIFSLAHPAAFALRGAGLLALDIAAPARRFLGQRMMYGARALP